CGNYAIIHQLYEFGDVGGSELAGRKGEWAFTFGTCCGELSQQVVGDEVCRFLRLTAELHALFEKVGQLNIGNEDARNSVGEIKLVLVATLSVKRSFGESNADAIAPFIVDAKWQEVRIREVAVIVGLLL